jgi:exodeoxyribonuclease-5
MTAPLAVSRPGLGSLTRDQQAALEAVARWYRNGGAVPLTLGGLAGTGKTTLAAMVSRVLPAASIAYAAYTGKAASVLRGALDEHGATPDRISTLHRLLYRPASTTTCAESGLAIGRALVHCPAHPGRPGPCPVRHQVSFTPAPHPLAGLDLVIADEASMIGADLWQDLTSHGVPVLAIGDHGQLPPVRRSGFSLMARPDLRLEQIHRQMLADPDGAGIVTMAAWARQQGRIPHGTYGPHVVKIAPDGIGRCGLHPAGADLILVARNRTRVWHNAAMRGWHGRSGPPAPGDRVICLRNDYRQGLYNGQRGTILATGAGTSGRYGEAATGMTIEMDDLDDPWAGAVAAAPFGQDDGQAAAIRDRDLAVFDFGYAITTHKAQGSGAGKVLVIEEDWPRGAERARWLYTAVTRAGRSLTVAGW